MNGQFKPGDIITAYHKGYWQVESIKGHILTYRRVDVAKIKPATKSCDQAWCEKVDIDELHAKMIEDADVLRGQLEAAAERLV